MASPDEQWQRSYEALLEYKAEHGHARVPWNYVTADGRKLGLWLSNQRRRKGRGQGRGQGRADRTRLLEEAGVPLDPQGFYAARWQQVVQALAEYKAIHGHPNVPQDYTASGVPVGVRLTTARHSRRNGTIDPALERALDELDVDWEPPSIKRRSASRCIVHDCARLTHTMELCKSHLYAWRQHGAPVTGHPPDPDCPVRGCDQPPGEKGWCPDHQSAVDSGHGRSAYRRRRQDCGGRCEVCRADHIRQRQEDRRRAAETEFPQLLRTHFIGRLWDGAPLDEACAEIGLAPGRLWALSRASLPELGAAADAALMARRDPARSHGREYTYMVHRCRCPECRAAKSRYR